MIPPAKTHAAQSVECAVESARDGARAGRVRSRAERAGRERGGAQLPFESEACDSPCPISNPTPVKMSVPAAAAESPCPITNPTPVKEKVPAAAAAAKKKKSKPKSKHAIRALQLAKSKIAVQLMELKEKLEELIKKEEYVEAGKIKKAIVSLGAEKAALVAETEDTTCILGM